MNNDEILELVCEDKDILKWSSKNAYLEEVDSKLVNKIEDLIIMMIKKTIEITENNCKKDFAKQNLDGKGGKKNESNL